MKNISILPTEGISLKYKKVKLGVCAFVVPTTQFKRRRVKYRTFVSKEKKNMKVIFVKKKKKM